MKTSSYFYLEQFLLRSIVTSSFFQSAQSFSSPGAPDILRLGFLQLHQMPQRKLKPFRHRLIENLQHLTAVEGPHCLRKERLLTAKCQELIWMLEGLIQLEMHSPDPNMDI